MNGVTVTPESLVANVRDLVSLPDVTIQINAMVDDPRHSATDIGDAIAQDPGLTARLLRIANSPYFGLATRVATVTRAVTVVGSKQLRDLVVATTAARSFRGIPNQLVSMDDFWYHSLYCGIISRLLGQRLRLAQADSLFVTGLLHDIGQLIIFNRLPEQSAEVLRLSMEDPKTMDMQKAELEVLGFDHAQVGGLLLKTWRLPPMLVAGVRYHHVPAEAGEFSKEAAIVHIANIIGTLAEINSTNLEDVPPIKPEAWTLAGLKDDLIEPVMRDSQKLFREARRLFLSDAA